VGVGVSGCGCEWVWVWVGVNVCLGGCLRHQLGSKPCQGWPHASTVCGFLCTETHILTPSPIFKLRPPPPTSHRAQHAPYFHAVAGTVWTALWWPSAWWSFWCKPSMMARI